VQEKKTPPLGTYERRRRCDRTESLARGCRLGYGKSARRLVAICHMPCDAKAPVKWLRIIPTTHRSSPRFTTRAFGTTRLIPSTIADRGRPSMPRVARAAPPDPPVGSRRDVGCVRGPLRFLSHWGATSGMARATEFAKFDLPACADGAPRLAGHTLVGVAPHLCSGATAHCRHTERVEHATTSSGQRLPFLLGCHSRAISGARLE
jgi:hypothetical protein